MRSCSPIFCNPSFVWMELYIVDAQKRGVDAHLLKLQSMWQRPIPKSPTWGFRFVRLIHNMCDVYIAQLRCVVWFDCTYYYILLFSILTQPLIWTVDPNKTPKPYSNIDRYMPKYIFRKTLLHWYHTQITTSITTNVKYCDTLGQDNTDRRNHL